MWSVFLLYEITARIFLLNFIFTCIQALQAEYKYFSKAKDTNLTSLNS